MCQDQTSCFFSFFVVVVVSLYKIHRLLKLHVYVQTEEGEKYCFILYLILSDRRALTRRERERRKASLSPSLDCWTIFHSMPVKCRSSTFVQLSVLFLSSTRTTAKNEAVRFFITHSFSFSSRLIIRSSLDCRRQIQRLLVYLSSSSGMSWIVISVLAQHRWRTSLRLVLLLVEIDVT